MAARVGGASAAGAPGVTKNQEENVCTDTDSDAAGKTKPQPEKLQRSQNENLQRSQSIVVDGLATVWLQSILINTNDKFFRTSR